MNVGMYKMKIKVTVTNIATDKIMKEETYELESLLTHILNELEDKINRDDLYPWRKFSVEIIENKEESYKNE